MASIENIKASDGSGNASLATVQSTRTAGSSTINVDTVLGINGDGFAGTMGTPHTFTDPVTSETITVISEATAVDFIGHVDGSNLEIDTIAPGYTDAGSEVGDIVIIRPTTQWGDEVAAILETAHNDDGSLKDDAVTTDVIADDAVTTDKLDDASVTPDKLATGAAAAEVLTSQTTTSTTYTDLATVGPTVTLDVGANGLALVSVFGHLQNSTASGESAFIGIALSGANTVAANDNRALRYQPWTANAFGQFGATFLFGGLTPGSTTFTLKYRTTAGTATFVNRRLSVVPL
jgi:hypothetical protein